MCLEDSPSVRMEFRLHIGGIVKDEPGKIYSQGPTDTAWTLSQRQALGE